MSPAHTPAQPQVLSRPRTLHLAIVFGFLVSLLIGFANTALGRDMPGSFADLAESVSPAVVNISTTARVKGGMQMPQFPPGSPFEDFFKEFFDRQGEGQPERKVRSLGSGFVIDEDGIVITNNHVIDEAEEIMVIFSNGEEIPAKLVGSDPKTDIAVLKVETDKKLPAVEWGDSDAARVGDWVVAIGNPLGLGGTVTAGIISARNRDIRAGPYDDFIQTDAPINRGNSGGPLFTMDGKVIGVNTAILSPNGGSIGIGFAVPETLAKPVVDQILEYGETRRGWLGVRIQHVSEDIAEAVGLDEPRGALVAGVFDGDPAANAGIEEGDVIVEFDGKPVDDHRTLSRLVADTSIGSKVDVVVWRDGKEKELTVHIARMEEAEAAIEEEKKTATSEVETVFGMTLSSLNGVLREQYGLADDEEGVLITVVERGSVAAEKNIRPGELVREVSGEEVTDPDQVEKRLEAIKKDGKKVALFMIRSRSGDLRFVPFRLDEDE